MFFSSCRVLSSSDLPPEERGGEGEEGNTGAVEIGVATAVNTRESLIKTG